MQVRGEPAYAKVIRWDRAIPQYNLGHQKIMAMRGCVWRPRTPD